MKKKSKILLVLVVSLAFVTFNVVNALEVGLANNQKREIYSLEDLLNDEQEQKEVKKELEEKPKIDAHKQAVSPFTIDIVGASNGGTAINKPYNGRLLEYVGGNDYLWFVTQIDSIRSDTSLEIIRHNIANNTNESVYSTETGVRGITYYLNGDILYVLYVKNYNISAAWGTEYPTSSVVGVNIKTGKVVYNNDFDVPQDCGYMSSFAVDNAQRFYFAYRKTGTRVFDKAGKLIYDREPIEDNEYFNFIKGVSPNGKALFFEVMYQRGEYAYFQSVYEGIQKLNNGAFVHKDYSVYGRGELGFSAYSYNPRWYFLDDAGNYAADQYGRIVKFDYTADNSMGVEKNVLLNLNSGVYDYTYYSPQFPNVCKNGNDIYLMGSNSNIYKVTQKGDTFTTSKYINAGFKEYLAGDGVGYDAIYTMTCDGNNLIISYYNDWDIYVKKISLADSSFTNMTNRVITQHTSMTHTQDDIRNKYKQMIPKYNYNTSIYKTKPSWEKPFSEGSLQNQVITDALNTLNYNRWIVGVPEITINTNKMARSQKCAVISKANKTISHTPTKPAGMADDFYKEAYDGCYAKYEEGDIYSGNVSFGDSTPYETIRGFISDLYNISAGSRTGHRQSMLDPKATQISFGYVETYGAASVYFDPNKKLNESYYAFPSAGYFPSEEMEIGEYWSIYIAEENISGTARVRFTYNGKQYNGVGLLWEDGYPVLSFKMPEELIKKLGNEKSHMPSGTSIQVEVLGVKDKNLNDVTFKYTVNFFNADTSRPITSVTLDKTNITLQKGKTAKINVTINPSNTTQSKVLTWSTSNVKVATIDANGNIKAIAPGTATITVKTSNGKTASVKVTVTNPNVPITGVKINQKNPTIMVGKTVKLTATITPGNTTQSKKVAWSTSNKKIATVDKNGVVKGIKSGTVNITVKTSNGKKATVKVTVKKPTPIKSVKLNKKTLKLELGKSTTVKATINPGNTTYSKKLTWSSSNKKVAVVDKNGKITAKASGTAKITVKTSNGKKATVKVTVSKISAKKAKISAIKNQVQNGKALKPAVTVKLGKTTLKNGRDYTVSYKNNKKAGKATVTVKFKGNYTGSSKKATFLIIPSKVNIKNPSTSKKAITVKYSKVSGAKTYQIAYRLKGTKKWSYTTSKSSSKKISKLTSGKQYEVIVRAGIKNGSKTLYGAWSNTKVIKVK